MEIWADTACTREIEELQLYYKLHGVTTNPAIMSEVSDPKAALKDLLAVQAGFLAVQIISSNVMDMLEEAEILAKINERIVVKIPCTLAGYQAMKSLSHLRLLATAILEPNQYALALHFKCEYSAPYLGHVLPNSNELLDTLLEIQTNNHSSTKIMGAAIKNPEMYLACVRRGIDAITAPTDVLMAILGPNVESVKKTQQMNAQFQSKHQDSSWKDY